MKLAIGVLFLFAAGFFPAIFADRRVICEGRKNHLSCRPGNVLQIRRAHYGRSGKRFCPSKWIKTTSCDSKISLSQVRRFCQNKPRCELYASDKVFGNPCPGTYKYLDVHYFCKPAATGRTRVFCQRRGGLLKCPNGKKMNIIYANYGRLSRRICRPPSAVIKTISCRSGKRAFDIVRKLCQNRSVCHLKAVNGVYGDPCPGTYKYLEVRYRCH